MSLNAYEIRLELLKMAQGLVTEQWYKDCDAIQSEHEKHDSKLEFPTMPSSEDIVKKANELYAFIEDDTPRGKVSGKTRGVCDGTGPGPGRAAGGRGQGGGRLGKRN